MSPSTVRYESESLQLVPMPSLPVRLIRATFAISSKVSHSVTPSPRPLRSTFFIMIPTTCITISSKERESAFSISPDSLPRYLKAPSMFSLILSQLPLFHVQPGISWVKISPTTPFTWLKKLRYGLNLIFEKSQVEPLRLIRPWRALRASYSLFAVSILIPAIMGFIYLSTTRPKATQIRSSTVDFSFIVKPGRYLSA